MESLVFASQYQWQNETWKIGIKQVDEGHITTIKKISKADNRVFSRDIMVAMLASLSKGMAAMLVSLWELNSILMQTFFFVLVEKHANWSREWKYSIDHFTVVSLVAWPSNESKAGVDLVLIETSLLNPHVNDAVLMLISMNLC